MIRWETNVSQSLSGWDGDFHRGVPGGGRGGPEGRNPFQGGMGISTYRFTIGIGIRPFDTGRNPFQGGMGISTQVFPGGLRGP